MLGKTYNFEIKDGTNRSGKLDSITTDYYYIDNPAMGPDRIRKTGVSKIKEIKMKCISYGKGDIKFETNNKNPGENVNDALIKNIVYFKNYFDK